MKKTFLSLGVIFISVCLSAQTSVSSFVKHGYKEKIQYTMSKGEFDEYHGQADVVEIGSVYFNTQTQQIVGFVEQEQATISSATPAMTIDPLCEKYYWISPYAFALNNPVRYTDPTGMWIVGMDGKPVIYDDKNGWSTNASEDVQKIGNAMIRTPEGKKVFTDMAATEYSITMNYKKGFHPEDKNKLGEAITNYNGNGNVTDVAINLYDGKIQEEISGYKQASQPGYGLQNPTEKQQFLLEQLPTMTERIGQVGAHEGTHATNPDAMYYKVGKKNAEQIATIIEMRVIQQTTEFNRPIRFIFSSLKIE